MNFSQIVQKLWRGEDVTPFLPTLPEPERRALLEITPLVKGESTVLLSKPDDVSWPTSPYRTSLLCSR